MYNNDMVKANMWYYAATNAVKYIYTLTADVTPMPGLKLHGDYAVGKLQNDVSLYGKSLNINPDTNSYYNLNASYSMSGFTGMIGYAGTDKTAAGKIRSLVTLAADAPVGANLPTANRYNIANTPDVDAWYGKIAYDIDAKTNAYVAYANINQGTAAGNNDSDDYTIGASYKYNKKLSFSGYYDILNQDKKANNNELRLETKYTF